MPYQKVLDNVVVRTSENTRMTNWWRMSSPGRAECLHKRIGILEIGIFTKGVGHQNGVCSHMGVGVRVGYGFIECRDVNGESGNRNAFHGSRATRRFNSTSFQ